MREVKISLVGYGVVGHGVVEVLDRKRKALRDMGLDLKLVSVTDHTGSVVADDGVEGQKILGERTLQQVSNCEISSKEIIRSVESDLVVEVTPTNIVHGQPGLGHMEEALSQGKHLVTSNKGPLVVAYGRLKRLAEDHGVSMKYEATVGGTMPLISLIERTLVGNNILGIRGIFNGTCNYILTRMTEEQYPYARALNEAQDLGYAEADPTYDVEGVDTAGKVVILANSIFDMNVKYGDVNVEGITRITPEALLLAKKRGYVIKLIGEVPALTVRPMLVPIGSPLAVGSTLNAAAIYTDLSGTITVTGLGAGRIETASAILSDIVSIYRTKSIDSIS
ncbi:MAG: homoserine dehydrogenase [Methanosaeta sp. PtaB.Bin039]|nr:MAG: homoserine dehydrogenase [Methanosaeta sp. PtaB.Bin039]HOT07634.1 homoserine dehydrogenase [Methanotrichaceae archaeon]HQF15682.1 homoserine dehydrogenase [Methanotrichaceae archaeon]HQI90418.1 homoserine dehydrogenase [Methanotrichaceae archaeon]HQJ28976.1 homoserine dehydrogenase [Methanotrichaceae archaeon]